MMLDAQASVISACVNTVPMGSDNSGMAAQLPKPELLVATAAAQGAASTTTKVVQAQYLQVTGWGRGAISWLRGLGCEWDGDGPDEEMKARNADRPN